MYLILLCIPCKRKISIRQLHAKYYYGQRCTLLRIMYFGSLHPLVTINTRFADLPSCRYVRLSLPFRRPLPSCSHDPPTPYPAQWFRRAQADAAVENSPKSARHPRSINCTLTKSSFYVGRWVSMDWLKMIDWLWFCFLPEEALHIFFSNVVLSANVHLITQHCGKHLRLQRLI